MPRPLRSEISREIANLAIEVGDPGRMARARKLHRAGGVGEVDITAGEARTSITGTDAEEVHDVVISVQGVTGRTIEPADITIQCVCDDDQDPTCPHGLAALLGLAEAFEANERLLDVLLAPHDDEGLDPDAGGSDLSSGFFGRTWRAPGIDPLPERNALNASLGVDGVDAGPVFNDAISALAAQLSRYRVHR